MAARNPKKLAAITIAKVDPSNVMKKPMDSDIMSWPTNSMDEMIAISTANPRGFLLLVSMFSPLRTLN